LKRTLFGLSLGLAAFAASLFAVNAFERAVNVRADLVAAPAVEELKSAPAPQPLTCRLHGAEMWPHRTHFEAVAVYSQDWGFADERSKGENRRRFPNFFVARKTGEKDEYGEVYLLYSCERCRAAYREWERRAWE